MVKLLLFYWDMNIVPSTEIGEDEDDIRHKVGNYFSTKEQAEDALLYVENALNDFWKEELK